MLAESRDGSSVGEPASLFGCKPDDHKDALARQLFQIRKRRVHRARANIPGVLDHAIEPAINEENGPFAQFAVISIRLPGRKANATDIAHPTTDGTLHRLRQRGLMNPDRI